MLEIQIVVIVVNPTRNSEGVNIDAHVYTKHVVIMKTMALGYITFVKYP